MEQTIKMQYNKIFIYMLMIILLSNIATANVFFYDNADSGIITDKWNIISGSVINYSTNQAYNGNRSIILGTGAAAINTSLLNESSYPMNISFNLFYSGTLGTNYVAAGFGDGCDGTGNGFCVGLRTASSPSNYAVVYGGTWKATTIPFYNGWANVTILFHNATHIQLFINGANATGNITGTNIDWSNPAKRFLYLATGSPSISSYIDNINVSNITIIDTTTSRVQFETPTPNNNSKQYYTNNSFIINTSTISIGGIINTTQNIYYENGSLYQTITNNTSPNTTNLISGLTPGIYYFNASITNSTFRNSTDTRVITIYNITSPIIIYPSNNTNFSRYLNINWSAATTTNNSVNIQNYRIYLNNTLINTTTTINISRYDTYYNNLSIGTYNVIIEANDTNGNKVNSTTIILTHPTNTLLNITGVDTGGNLVTNFNTTINNQLYTTTTGFLTVDLIKNTTYNIPFNATGFAYTSRSISIENYTQILNFTAYPSAALYLSIYDELTGLLITELVTITVTDITNPNIVITSTTNGTVLIQNLYTNDLLEVRFNSTNYSDSRNYQLILPNSYNILTAYLLPKSSADNFSICWYNTNGVPINSLHVYQWFLTNGSYALTQDVYSDINGRTSFVFTDTHYYLYNFSSTTYINSPFILNPPSNANTLASGCNYDITIYFSETAPIYTRANVTGNATFNNNTNILTFNYISYDATYYTYYYNVTKIVNGVEVVLCSDSSTSTTDTFTCNLFGYYDTIQVKGYADNRIFYGGYIQLNPSAKLLDNMDRKDASYIAGFIMLIIIFAGTFLGILGTMISGIIGLIIITWLGLVEPLTVTLIIAAIIVTIVINVGLRRYR